MFEFEPGLVIWTSVSFAILVILMYRLALPPLILVLKEREAKIADALAAAAGERKKSEEALVASRQKLSEVAQTAQKMVEEAKHEGTKAREEILINARREAEYLLTKAKEEMGRERGKLLTEVKEYAADLVVAAAGQVLRKKVDSKENRTLVEEAIRECKL